MNLDKAIEIIENYLRGDEPDDPTDLPKAFMLGSEAIKRIYNNRATTPGFNFIPLPGETEE